MKKRVSSIDIGTNTVTLLIAEIYHSNINVLYHSEYITSLGEGLIDNSCIKINSINRCIKFLREFKNYIKKYKVEKELCIATSALRQAKNKDEILKKMNSIGMFPIIISGYEEAKYIGKIVKYEFSNNIKNTLVIDIGGGSTELIYFKNSKIKLIESLEIGSVTLFEKFFSAPINNADLQSCKNFIKKKLCKSILNQINCSVIVGVGGTVTSLSAIFNNIFPYSSTKVHKSIIPNNSTKYLSNLLLLNTIEERANIPILEYKRARVIPAGFLIFQQIMNYKQFNEILICEKGLRWGVLLDYLSS